MRIFMLCIAMLGLLLPGLAHAGITLEGTASGIAPVTRLAYDPQTNRLVLNASETVANPVSREELLDIIEAVRLDDRLGVSVKLNNELIVYGKLLRRSPVARKLEDTDNFFRAVVFAERSLLRGRELPGGYRPKSPRNRERAGVIYIGLDNFEFRKTGGSYFPSGVKMDVILIPMAKYTAPDGGYLPDYDALEKGDYQEEDKQNTDHILEHKQAYMQMDVVANAIRIGEAAALVRFFRECGINLEDLHKSIDEADGRTLMGNPGQAQPSVVPATQPLQPAQPATAAPAVTAGQVAAIRKVFELDASYGSSDQVKLTRSTVNDGSYVAFRRQYLENIRKIDLSGVPEDFALAFRAHAQAWENVLNWVEGKKIGDTREDFDGFSQEHAPFRRELSQSYVNCKNVAAKYGVKVD